MCRETLSAPTNTSATLTPTRFSDILSAMENQEKDSDPTVQLSAFSGDPSEAAQWLEAFANLAISKRYDDAKKLEVAPSFFREVALDWYHMRDEAFDSWVAFESEFASRFMRPAAVWADSMVKLRHLVQQENTAFCTHLQEVLRLCNAADLNMTEREQIQWFLKSVRADYRPALVLAAVGSVAELRDKCALIDAIEPFCNKQSTPTLPYAEMTGANAENHFRIKTKQEAADSSSQRGGGVGRWSNTVGRWSGRGGRAGCGGGGFRGRKPNEPPEAAPNTSFSKPRQQPGNFQFRSKGRTGSYVELQSPTQSSLKRD